MSKSMVALITPFRNGLIDLVSLEKLIEFHVESGTDAIVVCGSTGEGSTLNREERELMIRSSVEIAQKRIKVVAGCCSSSTAGAIRLVQDSQKLGVDTVLVVVPYYVNPTQSGIVAHFSAIHKNSDIGIIMYNNPWRCVVGMTRETTVELADLKRIIALKDSNTDQNRISDIKRRAPHLSILCGDDASLFAFLENGCDGTISVVANIFPVVVKGILTCFKCGNTGASAELHSGLSDLNAVLFVEPNPSPVKYILSRIGLCEEEVKLPLLPVSADAAEKIDVVLKKLEIQDSGSHGTSGKARKSFNDVRFSSFVA